MTPIERATILAYHRHRLAEHGDDLLRAQGWRAPQSQRARFDVIAGVLTDDDESVLDVGCGCGDLLPYLDERRPGLRYLGIDLMPEFIALARQRHAARRDAAFEVAALDTALLPRAEVVVASGALGYRCADPHYLFNAIARLYAAAARVLVFNLLDAACFAGHPLLVGHDVAAVGHFCRHLAPSVELLRGYLADDATVVMRRG